MGGTKRRLTMRDALGCAIPDPSAFDVYTGHWVQWNAILERLAEYEEKEEREKKT